MSETAQDGSSPVRKAPTEHSVRSPVTTRKEAPKRPTHSASAKAEIPTEPKNVYLIPQAVDNSLNPVGNQDATFVAKLEGKLGLFYKRTDEENPPKFVDVDLREIHTTVILTLTEVITRALRSREYEPFDQSTIDAGVLAADLADGIVVMIYCKLRSLNYLQSAVMNRYLTKPVVPQSFEIPEPYALAVSQLGAIKVSGLATEMFLIPTIHADHTARFGLPTTRRWAPNLYCQAVEQAKKIGLHFQSVDLSVKMGSSWWLYQPMTDGDFFELQCLIPEENFTEQTALLRLLFAINGNRGYQSDIVDVSPLGNTVHGIMGRDPQDRVDLAVYYAVSKEAETMWRLA